MSRVICTLPNAKSPINGVAFSALEDGGLISEDVSDEVAAYFASIPGYELDELDKEDREDPEPVKQAKAPTKSKKQLAAEAKAAEQAEPEVAPEAPAATEEPIQTEVF